jgi:putative sulfotransferase
VPGKPTVGAAIITRDDLPKLKVLLDQLSGLDQVIVVDTGSRDGTQKYVRDLGAPFELHSFKWRPRPDGFAPDDWGFAAARNESFRHLKTSHAIWLDSDDTLALLKEGQRETLTSAEAAEALRFLAAGRGNHDLWLMNYLYLTDEFGNPSAMLAKERLVKLDVGWHWRYPVHEVLKPVTKKMNQVKATTVRDLFVVHHPHPTEVSVRRNAPMVRAWLRQIEKGEGPREDLARARYLMGRSLFGQGQHLKAARWFINGYLAKHPELSAEDKWQAWMDIGKNLVQAGDLDGARTALLQAISLCPRFGEAYVLLAEVKLKSAERPGDVLKLLEIADGCANENHGFVESNPLAMSFQVALLAAECRLKIGHHREALTLADRALRWRPSDPRARAIWEEAGAASKQSIENVPPPPESAQTVAAPAVVRQGKGSPPFFVVSSGRCGSTLISNMLNLHPQVLSLSEWIIMCMPGAFVDSPYPIHGPQFWAMLSTPRKRMTFMYQHDIVFDEVLYRPGPGRRFTAETGVPPILLTSLPHLTDDPEALYDDIHDFVVRQGAYPITFHYRRLFDWLRERFGRKVWVERSGSIMATLPELLKHFPDARFVHLFRDGRECAISMSKHSAFRLAMVSSELMKYTGIDPFNSDEDRQGEVPPEWQKFMPETFDRDAFWKWDVPIENFGSSWTTMERRGIELLAQLPRSQVHIVRYENLVQDPKNVLSGVLGFIGVDQGEEYLARAAAIVRPNPAKWPLLPEAERERLDQACRLGMALLYGPVEELEPAPVGA